MPRVSVCGLTLRIATAPPGQRSSAGCGRGAAVLVRDGDVRAVVDQALDEVAAPTRASATTRRGRTPRRARCPTATPASGACGSAGARARCRARGPLLLPRPRDDAGAGIRATPRRTSGPRGNCRAAARRRLVLAEARDDLHALAAADAGAHRRAAATAPRRRPTRAPRPGADGGISSAFSRRGTMMFASIGHADAQRRGGEQADAHAVAARDRVALGRDLARPRRRTPARERHRRESPPAGRRRPARCPPRRRLRVMRSGAPHASWNIAWLDGDELADLAVAADDQAVGRRDEHHEVALRLARDRRRGCAASQLGAGPVDLGRSRSRAHQVSARARAGRARAGTRARVSSTALVRSASSRRASTCPLRTLAPFVDLEADQPPGDARRDRQHTVGSTVPVA